MRINTPINYRMLLYPGLFRLAQDNMRDISIRLRMATMRSHNQDADTKN